jgi:DNA-binding transcriptional regulator YiaG
MTGAEIRALRKHLSENQTTFAARLGVHITTVSRWERGGTPPRGAALKALEALSRRVAARRRPDP